MQDIPVADHRRQESTQRLQTAGDQIDHATRAQPDLKVLIFSFTRSTFNMEVFSEPHNHSNSIMGSKLKKSKLQIKKEPSLTGSLR